VPRVVDPSTLRKGFGLASPETVEPQAQTQLADTALSLENHVEDPQAAHAASAISTTTSKGMYFSNQVQGDLDEISGIIPIRPPTVGGFQPILPLAGIPDWGFLKMADGGLVARGLVTPPGEVTAGYDANVYPYYWRAPDFTQSSLQNPLGAAFVPPGNDPATDPVFNLDPAGTADPTYTGGGAGTAHAGGYTRANILETARISPIGPGGNVVVSGMLFPADRGVVALFHWPPAGDVVAFLAQPLTTRVVAALKVGLGLSDAAVDGICDGGPGGIFSEGDPTYFDFPGRAAGQLNLYEIHLGIDGQTGLPLPAGPLPGAGQVRLGTDPNAGEPPVVGGIPILGASTIATGGGNDNNFFGYRLPYLENYEELTYTPAVQAPRYFTKPPVSLNFATDLTQAGNYTGYPTDFWTFQVARYRHRFQLQSPPSDQGSYMLLHFRTERDFEKFARDGVMPSDVLEGYSLYSAALSDDTDPEATDNVVSGTPSKTSLGYHVLRAAVVEDPNTPVLAPVLNYNYSRSAVDSVMFVSGVQYFVPITGAGAMFRIDRCQAQLTSMFSNGYLMGSDGTALEITPGMAHRDPVFLHLGGYTSTDAFIAGAGPLFSGVKDYQRMVFRYYDLGPYTLATPPATVDPADFALTLVDTPISFEGDVDRCHFSQDARLRVFAAKPLGHRDPTTAVTEFTYLRPGGNQVLYHTTQQSPTSPLGSYGNFTVGGVGTDPRPPLVNARKDVEERFLDEVYRYLYAALELIDPTYDAGFGVGNLLGPGLPFVGAPIELPVRIASNAALGILASALRTHSHEASLLLLTDEAQVAGLPDRSPPLSDGVWNQVPFAGMLMFPKTDYTTGFRPSVADGDITVLQPDYSAVGTASRHYVRVLDAAYHSDVTPEPDVVGQPLITLRIDGLLLEDFAYQPLGPGSPNVAIMVKIPGLTTWMDMGRRDGEGPSKQDALHDGAGCQVIGPNTFDGRDAITGVVYAQVQVHVGPVASVFANTDGTIEPGTAPVLVQAILKAAGSSLDFSQGGSGGTTANVRALVGITVLRNSTGEGPAPFGPV